MEVQKIKIVLVDNESRSLNRLKMLLSNFPDIEILEQTTDAKHGLDYILNKEPDLAFLDIEMPEITGLEMADALHKHGSQTKIVFFTAYDHYAIPAIKKNAFDYVLKPVSIDELKETIQRYKINVQSNLSKREYEIIRGIAKGLNSKAIAEELFISRHTVDTYRRTILEKTGCKNAAELIMYATKANII
jgi:DNA-binding NarL/FixJ family response regulator